MTRAEILFKKMPEEVDAIFINSKENRFYLTGFNSHVGYVLIFKSEVYLLVDFRYYEDALKKVKDNIKVILFKKFSESLKELIIKHEVKNVFLERKNLNINDKEKFEEIFLSTGIKNISCSEILDNNLEEMRSIKSEEEIKKIEEAQKLSEAAFLNMLENLAENKTEKEVALELEFFMRKNGADAVAFDLIIVSGRNSSMPHGVPSNKKIKKHEFITVDMGAKLDGYRSDMTRTFSLGSLSQEEKDIYNIVLKAQEKAVEFIKPGIIAGELDNIARNIIKNAGFGENFGHSTGHGVGLEIHEEPRISPDSKTLLKEGMVITIEPGIYIKNKFGVRIEDMLVITKNSFKNLNSISKKILEL